MMNGRSEAGAGERVVEIGGVRIRVASAAVPGSTRLAVILSVIESAAEQAILDEPTDEQLRVAIEAFAGSVRLRRKTRSGRR